MKVCNVGSVRAKLCAIGLIGGLSLSIGQASAQTRVNGFSDVGYRSSKTDDNATTSEMFHGGIDFYYTKKIGEETNFLAEIVFEMGEDNGAILDPERLWIQRRISPWLKIKFGRVHTALGYWNDTYHHGSWLQDSVSRPMMYSFEDDGGILPVHTVGLELRGGGRAGPGKIGYIANIGNGRGPQADPPQVVNDADDKKAINAVVFYEMKSMMGLRIGGTFYKDSLPGFDNDDNSATAKIAKGDESIVGAHLVIQPGKGRIIAEHLTVSHDYSSGSKEDANKTVGMYVHAAYEVVDSITPYFRYDSIDADEKADAYSGFSTDTTGTTVGVRFDIDYTNAIKVEYNKIEVDLGTKKSNTTNFGVNWSFGW